MKIRYSPKFLEQIENIFLQAGYLVRYEKGNFHSGYCVLKEQKIVVVNKYFPIEGKINCLVEILKTVVWDFSNLGEKEKALYLGLVNHNQLEIEL